MTMVILAIPLFLKHWVGISLTVAMVYTINKIIDNLENPYE